MTNTYHNNDSGGTVFDHTPGPPSEGLDLLTDPIDAAGDPVDFERQGPNGRFADDPDPTSFGVDRGDSGAFVSKERAPTTLIRHDDGELGSNPFAVGNFGTFDEDFRYSSGDGP